MPLAIGARLGPYEIVGTLGAGGMGEVYRARDPRLNRVIAIKLLPPAAANDAERRERFEREAQAIAALNHHAIVTIYSVERADGQFFLTMELVEGQPLVDVIPAGGLPLDRVLRIMVPVADAIAAAHQKGITHRDLKPANIMIGGGEQDGRVKVLDFGLAKLTDAATDINSAMPTALATGEGKILGTIAYMSPEQAEGKAIDARSDLFSLGVMLYEMTTGRRPFTGDSSIAIISAIVKDTPAPVTEINHTLPREFGRIVRRALAKDPERRYQTAKDLRNDLEALGTSLQSGELPGAMESGPVVGARGARALPWLLAALASVGLLWLALVHFRERPASSPLVKSSIVPPIQLMPSSAFSLSPDGQFLAFMGAGPDGVVKLWVDSLDGLRDPWPLSGTETTGIDPVFWSPDSKSLAYGSGGELMKVSLLGGAPQPVCQLAGEPIGGAWNRDDVIVVGNTAGGLLKCAASGGAAATTVTTPSSQGELHLFPSFLPDGKRFIYSRISRTAPEKSGIFVGSLADDPTRQNNERRLLTGFSAAYVPSRNSVPGQILYMLEGVLYAQRFDDRQMAPVGEAVPIAPQVGSFLDFAFFSVSTGGLLVSKAPDPDTQLTWFDRKGHGAHPVGAPGAYTDLALSPDGTRAIAVKHNSRTTADQDLWELDVSGNEPPRKRTLGADLEMLPVWVDNDHIVYAVGGGGEKLYEMSASGADSTRPLPAMNHTYPTSVSRDRLSVLVTKPVALTGDDLWIYSLAGERAGGYAFLTDQRDQEGGQLSPDGNWVAYVSNENGPRDVFIAPVVRDQATGVMHAGRVKPISNGGGAAPRWSSRSGDLFYLATDGTVMFSAKTGQGFSFGVPTEVKAPLALRDWGVSPDGDRFLLAVRVSPPSNFDLRANWDAVLKPR